MPYNIAGIDVHKRVLAVVIADRDVGELRFECRRFGTTTAELRHLSAWLSAHEVQAAVMESTAQYWKPVWRELKGSFGLHLAQAQSNKAPKGRKDDMADSKRLVRRFIAGELYLSFVPEAEQQGWRTLTRGRLQMTRDRSAVICQVEALLEEARIKLSGVIADLWGASGKRILRALAEGETDARRLAALGDARLKCDPEKLRDALEGAADPVHLFLLKNHLERLDLLDRQIDQTHQRIAQQLHHHQDAVLRLTRVPGLRVDAAQQIIAEVGVRAEAFEAPEKLSSWAGVCPGRNESAGISRSGGSPKGNPYYRRILSQVAQAATRTRGSYFEALFRRLAPRLGFAKSIWAIAHRICRIIWKILHDGVEYRELGSLLSVSGQKRRIQRLSKELRLLGYSVTLTSSPATLS